MKTSRFSALAVLPALLAGGLFAQDNKAPEAPVPVTQIQSPAPPAPAVPPDNQQIYGGARVPLVTPETARAITGKFRAAFAQTEGPRFVFYVNRELIDADSGLRLTKRMGKTHATRTETSGAAAVDKGSSAQTEEVTAQNTYQAADAPAPTLADRQTVREVERLFGRPFRAAGARLADQKVAAALIADKPFNTFAVSGSDAARKDREALSGVADIAVEVLVSSRDVTVTGISGDRVVSVPDIQATAIRLKDAAIIGQASSADVLGQDAQAARLAQRYDVRDITEATALALMEDMLTGAK